MYKIFCSLFLVLFLFSQAYSQKSIDGGFQFQTDNNKKYSIYEPSQYDPSTPQAVMLGLHPLNTNRWNAQSWRDTLIQFAETNQLLLVCPDGGPDGRVDDAIDTAFTSVLLDSVRLWYNIDESQKYIMGFSWGGKTSYTYGLRRAQEFRGFLIIGAAINGVSEVQGIIENAKSESFYLIHGSNDATQVRYFPLVDALNENGACLETNLLPGVGHTIDFPNRNNILTEGFQWLKDNPCNALSTSDFTEYEPIVYPNPNQGEFQLQGIDTENATFQLLNMNGQAIHFNQNNTSITIDRDFHGIAVLVIKNNDWRKVVKLIIH